MYFDDLPEAEQNKYYDKATELLEGLLWCERTWEAWGHGTMTKYDFIDAADDDNIIYDTAVRLHEIAQYGIT